MAGYDAHFFLSHLITIVGAANISIIKTPEGRVIKIVATYNKLKFTFADSYNLYKGSLKDLASPKQFDVPTQKGTFPYDFVSKETLYYTGPSPEGVEPSILLWDLKAEALKYLATDRALWALSKFDAPPGRLFFQGTQYFSGQRTRIRLAYDLQVFSNQWTIKYLNNNKDLDSMGTTIAQSFYNPVK